MDNLLTIKCRQNNTLIEIERENDDDLLRNSMCNLHQVLPRIKRIFRFRVRFVSLNIALSVPTSNPTVVSNSCLIPFDPSYNKELLQYSMGPVANAKT